MVKKKKEKDGGINGNGWKDGKRRTKKKTEMAEKMEKDEQKKNEYDWKDEKMTGGKRKIVEKKMAKYGRNKKHGKLEKVGKGGKCETTESWKRGEAGKTVEEM